MAGKYLCRMPLSRLLIYFGFLPCLLLGQSQKPLGLADCIDLALKNNIDVLLSEVNQSQSEIDYQQSKWNLGPNLSLNGGQFYQSGRSIDRFTNQFVQETVGNTSAQLQSSWVVFAGGSIRKGITRSKKTWQASQLELQQSKQNIALSVALAYLQCLQGKELVTANESNKEALLLEKKRIEKLVSIGNANEGILLSANAQLAQANAQYILAKNQLNNALLNLKNLLRLPLNETLEIEYQLPITPEYTQYPISLNELIDSALSKRADYQAAKLRQQSALLSVGISKAQLYPVISVGGNLSTVYSDKAVNITGYQIAGSQPIGLVQGTNQIVEAPIFNYQTQTIEFGKQMRDNFGQSFGANMSIPIFNQMQARNGVKMSKLNYTQSTLNVERIKQNAVVEISNAYQSFQNAAMNFQAQRENHEAQKRNLEFTQKRFENGQATYFELQLAQNQELTAYQNFLSNKYETALRNLILDVMYRGDLNLLKP